MHECMFTMYPNILRLATRLRLVVDSEHEEYCIVS